LAIKTSYEVNGRGKFINRDDVIDYTSDYTVSFWIKPDAFYTSYHHVFDVGQLGDSGNRDSFNLHNIGGGRKIRAVRQRSGAGNGADGTTIISTGTWIYITIVGNSTSLSIFLNESSTPEATIAYSNAAGGPSNTMTLAHYMGDQPSGNHEEFEGSYAAIKIWTAELTPAEFKQEMYSIRPLRSANLWAAYNQFFNGNIPDVSGNGRHWKPYTIVQPGQVLAEGPPISWSSMVLSEVAEAAVEEEERLMQLLLMGGRKVLAPRSRL
jgi:hypothetical protein